MTRADTSSRDSEPSTAQEPAAHPLLGRSLFAFETTPRRKRRPRSIILLGLMSVVVVPVSLTWVPGTVGTVIAVLAGLVALTCYLLSGSGKRPPSLRIEVFERGVAASQADASRALLWNQIVDVSCHRIVLPNGRTNTAIVFEVVGEPPLLVMVGPPSGPSDRCLGLIEALSTAWLEVWARRARVLLDIGREVTVGNVCLSRTGVRLGDRLLEWGDLHDIDHGDAQDRLVVGSTPVAVECSESSAEFPSAARRVLAIAKSPPTPPLLPQS